MAISRRSFLKIAVRSTAAMGAMSVGGLGYSTRIEPYQMSVTRLDIPLAKLPGSFDGFTIAHISDLHLEGWMTDDYIDAAMEQVTALEPDVIALTGDYITHHPDFEVVVRVLKHLRAREGIYATLGNHDHWVSARRTREALQQAGVSLVLNDYVMLRRGEETLYMAGVDDIWEKQNDLDRALDGIPDEGCVVLLAHEPDYADTVRVDGRVSLQLSGHTHGGQFRVPGVGAIQLPYLGRRYQMGLYNLDPLTLFVTRGIGMVRPFVRFNCPPEIALLTLRQV